MLESSTYKDVIHGVGYIKSQNLLVVNFFNHFKLYNVLGHATKLQFKGEFKLNPPEADVSGTNLMHVKANLILIAYQCKRPDKNHRDSHYLFRVFSFSSKGIEEGQQITLSTSMKNINPYDSSLDRIVFENLDQQTFNVIAFNVSQRYPGHANI